MLGMGDRQREGFLCGQEGLLGSAKQAEGDRLAVQGSNRGAVPCDRRLPGVCCGLVILQGGGDGCDDGFIVGMLVGWQVGSDGA